MTAADLGLALRMELRRSRSVGFWLAVTIVGYVGVVALFYPMIQQNAQAVEDYLKLFPKGLMAAFGMSGNLDDPGVFFTTYIGSFLWPVVAAIGAILLGTRASAGDAERGWLDLSLGTPLTRAATLVASIVGQVTIQAGLALLTVITLLVAGKAVGAPFDAARFLVASIPLFAFSIAIAGVATLLAVVTLSRSRAAGITVGILLAMYLANIAGQLEPGLDWLPRLSAFHYLDVVPVIDAGAIPAGESTVFGAVAVIGWAVAVWRFRSRDILA